MEQHHGEGSGHHKSEQITLKLSTRSLRIVVVIIVLAILGYYYKGLFVAANVNGSFISRLAVVRELESVSGKQALDSLVAEKLINAEAARKGVTVTDEDVSAEIAKIGEQMKAQGGTLEQALAAQGVTIDTLKKQLRVQKTLEKLVSGTVQVSDEEAIQYLKDNKVTIPKGQESAYNELAKNQLTQQKLNAAKTTFIADLKAKATIHIFTNY